MKILMSICCSLMAIAVSAEEFVCPDALFKTYHQGMGGTIQLDEGASCQEMIVTATPNTGYEFVCWEDNSTDNPRTYTYNGGDFQLRAVFGKTEDLHVQGGDVRAMVTDVAAPTYQLQAVDGSCGTFVKWSNGSTTNPLAYIESDGTRKPTFSYTDYLWQTDNHEGGIIKVTPLSCGFTFEAIPNDGYHFAYWNEDKSTNPLRDEDWIDQHWTAVFAQGAAAIKNGTVYASVQGAIDTDGDEPISMIESSDEDITVSKPVTLQGNGLSLRNLTIANGGDLTLANELTANNLYLNSTTGSSSQLRNANYLTYDAAFVDIHLDPVGAADPDKWYAFAVPFEVDVLNGVRRASEPDAECVNFTDYLIWEYDGTLRASNMENGWVKMTQGTLQPGRFYMIGVDGTQNTWRFAKKADATLGGDASVAMYEFASNIQNQGWNAVANSSLVYSNAATNGNITIAQVYANGAASERYDVKNFAEASFVMGSPFFIQTAGADQLNLTPVTAATQHTLYAPARTETAPYYKLQLMQSGEEKDIVYLTASEDAADEYVIGKDVLKMIGGNGNPYLWVNGYGYRLCAQDVPMEGGVAEYSLSAYAPSAATYALQAGVGQLLYNDELVWDFANGPYELDLAKGINNGYTYRIGTIHTIPTAMEQAQNIVSASKFIHRGVLYIFHNGKLYNAQGQMLY